MKTPKYTDLHKYPNGYVPSGATNVKETFERAEKRLQADKEVERKNAEERLRKTIALKARTK